jgi:thymidylate synthase
MQGRETDTDLEFIPLHFGNKLRIVNPRGRVGIITLWSKIDFVEKKLAECGADLNPETSPVAVIGNLYGNGLPHLLRNLLYNPQIRDLVVCGADRSGSADELTAFFENGLEEAVSLGETVTRIRGTNRIIDPLVTPDSFSEKPRIVRFGDLSNKTSAMDLFRYLLAFEPRLPLSTERIEVELPEVKVGYYPSEPRNHNIVRNTPLEAWRELVFRLVRFGHLTHLRKGDRQELQNVPVVVRKPQRDDPAELAKFNFTVDELLQYQQDMLAAELPEDQPYTYGNRIRRYYGFDALDKFADRLRENPQDRDCYLALWDSHKDIDAEDGPCLVSMFFRVYDEKLTLTANYRTHNALDAWLKNVYGLMEAQRIVAEKSGIEIGPLTVISHSISVDPSKYDVAQRIAGAKGFEFDLDPNGQFLFAVDREAGEIVVQHVSEDGVTLHEYRSDRPQRIQHELARDCAISDIGHAIYVGRQLTRAEMCLRTGEQFVEE